MNTALEPKEHKGLLMRFPTLVYMMHLSPQLTCILRRFPSSAFVSALTSSLGALMYRKLVVEMRSELKGLLMEIDMLLSTILTMRVSSRNLCSSFGVRCARILNGTNMPSGRC